MTPAARAVIEAARLLVERERWRMGLPTDRTLPNETAAALERALAVLGREEACQS